MKNTIIRAIVTMSLAASLSLNAANWGFNYASGDGCFASLDINTLADTWAHVAFKHSEAIGGMYISGYDQNFSRMYANLSDYYAEVASGHWYTTSINSGMQWSVPGDPDYFFSNPT